jgi:lipopolysaccharide transport system ATP-binding protein
MDLAVRAEQLSKRYSLGTAVGSYSLLSEDFFDAVRRVFGRQRALEPAEFREIWALNDVSFDIRPGEIVGVLGRNGAGKTTLLKVLARITDPTSGRAVIKGRVGSLLEVGTGFHQELTGRENVFLNGAILGMRSGEIKAKFDDIIEFAELQRFVDTPVKRYSSGMYVRLAFAVAAFLEPEILFIDEVLSVGDQAFQQRCLGRMGEIASSGRTIVYVSHNLASVSALCDRALLMEGGRLVLDGPVEPVLEHYLSTVQIEAAESLDHRQDRDGDGRLRIRRAVVSGPDGGPVRTGERCTFSLDYTMREPVQVGVVTVAVEGPFGEPLFVCSSAVSGDHLSIPGDEGAFVCTVPSIPLLAGRYSVTISVQTVGTIRDETLLDKVRNAVFFDVFETDVFGTGRLPNPAHGRILVEHSWHTEESRAAA